MNASSPAFPEPVSLAFNQHSVRGEQCSVSGMDLRTYIATAALQGYLAGRSASDFPGREDHHAKVAVGCLKYADALIAELNRKEGSV